jgi:hypothetical protein
VPGNANYDRFYAAAPSVAWQVQLHDAGHFQFLDTQTALQQAICLQVSIPSCFGCDFEHRLHLQSSKASYMPFGKSRSVGSHLGAGAYGQHNFTSNGVSQYDRAVGGAMLAGTYWDVTLF